MALIHVRLEDQHSLKVVQLISRMSDPRACLHCVLVQHQEAPTTRMQTQATMRSQFGSLLQAAGQPFRLHIIRLSHLEPGSPTATTLTAQALRAKAEFLGCSLIVVGDSGGTRHSEQQRSLAESLRRHSRTPVLAISAQHPLLAPCLPAIAEDPVQELLRSLSRSFDKSHLPGHPSFGRAGLPSLQSLSSGRQQVPA